MKIFSYLLAGILALSAMTACGANDNSVVTPTPSASPQASQNEHNVNKGENDVDDGMDSIGDAANSITDGAGDAIKDATQGVENAVGDMTGNK